MVRTRAQSKLPRVPARKFNREPSQKQSWGNVSGHPEFPGLIGQIFFATNDKALDADDLAVLAPMTDYLRGYFHRYARDARKLFKFVGNADHRGSAAYNLQLARQRAEAVQRYWDNAFFGARFYHSSVESQGESKANRTDMAGSRRVDIFSNILVPRDESVRFDDEIVNGKYRGQLSNRFLFRNLLGGTVGAGVLSGGVLSIEIEDARTGRRAMYTYTGAGTGVGFTLNRPTDWEEKVLPVYLEVDDFEGPGRVMSVGVLKTLSTLVFEGPMERGLTAKPVEVEFIGWDFSVGAGKDVTGYWHRRD
jgi:outer membrane protein OmpA-like peptidoglycan-associated protein